MDYASTLTREVLLKIFSGLTLWKLDSVRDLCAAACVCPSWREVAKEPSLWRYLFVTKAPLNERLTGPRLRNLVARSRNTLTWLSLHGCPLVNDAVLSRVVQTQPCLDFVSVTDCALATRPCLAYALCDSEDFQGVVAQLNDPLQSAADAQRCCVALRMLLSPVVDKEATLAEAQAAGVLEALLRCAALQAAHAGVQAACFFALSRYLQAAHGTVVASYPRIFQAAVAALKAYPLDTDVQQAALAALTITCSYGLERTPGVPALLAAIPHVLAALRAFPTNQLVQQPGCILLAKMCGMDASVAEAVAAAGAMGFFIKALNFLITINNICTLSVTVVELVEAIGAIAFAPAALPQATVGIDAVVRALRRYEKSSMVAEAACKTLGIYLRCAVTRERALQGRLDYVVRTVAQVHSTDAKVTKAAKDALQDPQACACTLY